MIQVQYINHMGNALTITNAARVSFGSEKTQVDEKDKKLIKYLADHKHMSPFEHCLLSVKITCPLYIRSQIHRHRTFAYNEISRRYTSKELQCFMPDQLRKQSSSNRQASEGSFPSYKNDGLRMFMDHVHKECLAAYEHLIDEGVCREQARGILPQNLLTEFYMTGNLRNWSHFISLRDHGDAQGEVQQVAKQCKDILLDKFEYAAEVLLG